MDIRRCNRILGDKNRAGYHCIAVWGALGILLGKQKERRFGVLTGPLSFCYGDVQDCGHWAKRRRSGRIFSEGA